MCLLSRFLSLVDHERAGHPDSFICILCGLPCLSAENLIDHCDLIHGKKSAYICRYVLLPKLYSVQSYIKSFSIVKLKDSHFIVFTKLSEFSTWLLHVRL